MDELNVLQMSTRFIFSMYVFTRVRELEGIILWTLDLSRCGSNTKLRSAPIIKLVFDISGIKPRTFLKISESSQFGPYLFSNIKCTDWSCPKTITYRPFLSAIVDKCLKGTPFRIKIAVPLAFVENLEWYIWSIHLHLNLPCASFDKCVSCRNIMSACRDFRWESTLPLFIWLLTPLTFHEHKLTPLCLSCIERSSWYLAPLPVPKMITAQ